MSPETHKPRVSIVMSFYNEPLQWIQLALSSILQQTFPDFELIVVCDNPQNHKVLAYIEGIKDTRIKLIINKENQGPTKSFNIAISASCGEYIAKMDADDICMPERLQEQVTYLDSHPEISVCASDAHHINTKGKIIRRKRYRKKRNHSLLVIQNCIAHSSAMFRRSLLELRSPLYNEDFRYAQDYELWQFLLLQGCKMHTLDKTLILYRKSSQHISRKHKSSQRDLFRKARKSFIMNWMVSRDIIAPEDEENLKTMLTKASEAYSTRATEEERKYLANIIYILYFTLVKDDWKYRLRYLTDKNLIAFRLRPIFTLRLLFTGRKRNRKPAFI